MPCGWLPATEYQIYNNRKDDAEYNTADDGDEKGEVAAAIDDIAREAVQAEAAGDGKYDADRNDQ